MPDEVTEADTPMVHINGRGDFPAHPEVAQHVETLGLRLNELNAAYQQQRRRADQRQSDIRLIAELLREEAEKRDWCSDYGVFVDEVNSRTSENWLEKCAEEHQVTFEATLSPADLEALEGAIDDWLSSRERGTCGNFHAEPLD